eukprot:COSAG02_NODE_66193_length_256_cov_0.649682_1_plen_21_part_01
MHASCMEVAVGGGLEPSGRDV